MPRVELALTEPQEEFVCCEETNPAIIGGLGSGKSRAGTARLIYLMMDDPGVNTAYYMPTYDLLKLRAMPGFEEDLRMFGLNFTINKSEYRISVAGLGDIIFRSYDNPNRIIAYEVAHSIVDELDTLRKDDAAYVWRKIDERNRQRCKRPNSIGCVTTPDQGYNGFIYQRWYKEKPPGYVKVRAPTYSNPFLPDGYVENIRKNYDALLANMYIEGEIVNLNDKKVYHFFDRVRHHSDREIKAGDRLFVGIDFNVGGCCAVTYVIDGVNVIAVDEFVSHDTHDFVNNLTRYQGHSVIVFPDASGSSRSTNADETDHEIIMSGGYAVEAPAANPGVRSRINAFNALISHGRYGVNTNKCPEHTTALETQGYDKNGEPEKFKDHPAVDDWVDGPGYFIHERFPIRAISQAAPVRMF